MSERDDLLTLTIYATRYALSRPGSPAVAVMQALIRRLDLDAQARRMLVHDIYRVAPHYQSWFDFTDELEAHDE